MVRFLNSIHIENLDDFDVDFEMVARDRFKHEQINMVIIKNTPWKYHLLRRFQDGLNEINYPYLLRFSYRVRPDFNDVKHLFADWYQTLYRLPHNLEIIDDEDGRIKIEYLNEAEKEQYHEIINDFRDFLKFICYEFVIVEEIKPAEEEGPEISKRKLKQIVKNAEIEAEESMEASNEDPQIADRNDVIAMREEEKRSMNEEV